jgi:hypothetical protein
VNEPRPCPVDPDQDLDPAKGVHVEDARTIMSHPTTSLEHLALTRRGFLHQCGMGMGVAGLTSLLGSLGELQPRARAAIPGASAGFTNPLMPRGPQFPGRAKRVIHIFANGGPSHVDTFDPKPALDRWHGKEIPVQLKTERRTGAAFRSPFKFSRHGQCGLEVSELFAHVAQHADDLCVIRSMKADVPNHEPSLLLMNCGEARLVRPSFGSWVTYGLGSENQNMPGFVVMCPGGYPIQESQNWQSAFLPGVYQGTYINTEHTKIERLIENISNPYHGLPEQRAQLDLLQQLNQRHQRARAADAQVDARIQSFELAYRMQMDATDAFDIQREPEHVRRMYGEGTQARHAQRGAARQAQGVGDRGAGGCAAVEVYEGPRPCGLHRLPAFACDCRAYRGRNPGRYPAHPRRITRGACLMAGAVLPFGKGAV